MTGHPSSPKSPEGERKIPVQFSSGDLQLEGVLHLTAKPGQPGLVFCPPHPLFGGTMEYSLGYDLAVAAAAHGINALRFNYRGVGNSQGSYGQGLGETHDAAAAVHFLRTHPHVDGRRIALVGYSFGGSVALAAALQADPAALVTISAALRPPAADPNFVSDVLRYIRCPTYIIHGRDDPFISFDEAESIHAQLHTPEKYLRLIRGADHFYTGRQQTVISMVVDFLKEKLRP